MEEVSQELSRQGVEAEVVAGEGDELHLELNVKLGNEQNFTYQVWPRTFSMPSFARRANEARSRYYRLEVYLLEGSQGYDLIGFNREQVINDILDQYERHLQFLHMSREAPGSGANVPDDPTMPSAP